MNSGLLLIDICDILILSNVVALLDVLSVPLVHIRKIIFKLIFLFSAFGDSNCEICFEVSFLNFLIQASRFVIELPAPVGHHEFL